MPRSTGNLLRVGGDLLRAGSLKGRDMSLKLPWRKVVELGGAWGVTDIEAVEEQTLSNLRQFFGRLD